MTTATYKSKQRMDLAELAARIAGPTGNPRLAADIAQVISQGLRNTSVQLVPGNDGWGVFNQSLTEATRDIARHPLGLLLQRLIKYGPLEEGAPLTVGTRERDTVSDEELGSCLEFVFSHMVNRFKGELAELLGIELCANVLHEAQAEGLVPPDARLWWGDVVRQRRRLAVHSGRIGWGGYARGADGLIVAMDGSPGVHGIVEVKSMAVSNRRVHAQIDQHIARLDGGVRLLDQEFGPEAMHGKCPSAMIRILVRPAKWKLGRQSEWQDVGGRQVLVFPGHGDPPPTRADIQRTGSRTWDVTLAWSKEALAQSAYEMTFWYMGQVGKAVFTSDSPSPWDMNPDEAGRNSVKEALYHIGLRPMTDRQDRLWRRLYNVYSFGYVPGVDAKCMLWPEDFQRTSNHRIVKPL